MAELGFNLPTLVAQIVNFLILLGLLYLVAYKPILRMFNERSNKVRESMEQTEAIKEQSAHAEEETRKLIEAASKEGQEAIARAVQTAEEIKQKAQQEARPEAEAIIDKARLEIQRERDEAIDELRKEVADLTIEAAEKVIEQALDKQAHLELINKVLDKSEIFRKN
ncbi:F0F1 ATP synthase subunit B [Chloroflexota bacterium]